MFPLDGKVHAFVGSEHGKESNTQEEYKTSVALKPEIKDSPGNEGP